MAFDFSLAKQDWITRIPGDSPWDRKYTQALAVFLDGISRDALLQMREALGDSHFLQDIFHREKLVRQVEKFLAAILAK